MSPQVGFLLQDQVLPRLRAVIPRSDLCVGSEDAEELVADSCALAARIMHNAEAKGKTVTASSASYYALQYTKSGRRAVGNSCVDAYGSATQIQGKSRLDSLETVVAIDEITGGEVLLHDVLADDHEDPGTRAARKLDWETFMAGLSEPEKAVVLLMIEGKCGSAIARALRTTDSKIQSTKRNLAKLLINFMGPEILQEVQRRPQWKADITATKEKMACKYDRLH
jgi:hypothetical protein